MPKLLTTPFASEATSEYRTDVQNSTGAEPNSATYEQGFPPVTMEKIAVGGKPPKGSDLNGVLYDITDNLVSLTKGARYGFNESYATAIGGYPLGAVLRLENGVEVESEVDANSINPNVDMTGWKLAVSDNGIVTWSGRTQEQKNKENPSPFDFKAIGDGVTDDTQAFVDLEAAYQGRQVDLLGKTYVVDHVPTMNKYTNGYFKVGDNYFKSINDVANINKTELLLTDINVHNHFKRYSLIRDETTGGINSTVQGVAYDAKNERLFEVAGGGTDGRGHSLNIFKASTIGRLTDYVANRSTFFGHQGAGLTYDKDKTVVWMSRNFNYEKGTGNKVVAFDDIKDVTTDSIVSGMTVFDVFDQTDSTQSTSPTVSSCGRFLITRFTSSDSQYTKIRIFDVKKMWENRSTKLDYSKDYLNEFSVLMPEETAFQGISSDGVYIYLLFSEYGFNDNAWVYIYTLDSEFVNKVNISNIGELDAINDSPNPSLKDGVKEYEGLLIFTSNKGSSLGVVLSTTYNKDNGKKNVYIYEVGSDSTTVGLKNGNVTAGVNILHSASPRMTRYNFGVKALLGENDSFWSVNQERKGILTNNGNPIFWSNGVTGGVQVVSNGSEGMSNILLARTDTGAESSRLIFHKSRSGSTDSTLLADIGSARLGRIVYSGDTTAGHKTGVEVVVRGVSNGSNIEGFYDIEVYNGIGGKTVHTFKKDTVTLSNLRTYTDNTTAKAGGLAVDDVYRTTTGQLMIVY